MLVIGMFFCFFLYSYNGSFFRKEFWLGILVFEKMLKLCMFLNLWICF